MNLVMTDTLDIPPFLRVDESESERRRQWWKDHPPTTSAQTTLDQQDRKREVDEMRAKFAQEKLESEKVRLNSLNARKKLDAKSGAFDKQMPGTHWDGTLGRYVSDNAPMPRAKFERLLREMPTEEHRQTFIRMYGAGQCLDTASYSMAAATARPTLGPPASTGNRRSKTSSATPTPSRPKSAPPKKVGHTESAGRKALVAASGKASKEEQVAHIKTMLERPEGATLAEAGARFGWQEHSTSAFLSTQFRNKGMPTTKEKIEGRGTVYRLAR